VRVVTVRTSLVAPLSVLAALSVALAPARADGAEGTDAGQALPVLQAGETTAPEEPARAAERLFKLAEADDARGDYALASARYRAAVAMLPSYRFAGKAITRAAMLEAHAEGSYAPYAQLEAVRRDPKASSDPSAIDALAVAADAFPPGPTRGEARMLCAEAYIARLHRRADGETELRKVIDDARADGLLRREAAGELVTALIDDGDLETARATVASLGQTLDPRMAQKVTELLRRRRVHLASIADLILFALLAGLAIARSAARRRLAEVGTALRRTLPVGCAFAAYSALGGGWLASSYEAGNAAPFLAFGAVLLPVSGGAIAWGAAGSPKRSARTGRAVLCATAVVAAAFLTLEAVNKQYLESFKL